MTSVSVVVIGSILIALSAWSVLTTVLPWPTESFDRLLLVADLGDLLVGLGALTIAIVLVGRLRSRADARALALFLTYLGVAVAPRATELVTLAWLPRAVYAGALGFTLAAFLHFTLEFPGPPGTSTGRSPALSRLDRILRTLARYRRLVWAWGAVLALLWYGVLVGLSRETAFLNWGMYPASRGLLAALMLANLMSLAPIAMGLVSLLTSYVHGTTANRRKVLWIAEAAIIGVVGFVCVELAVLLNAVSPRTILVAAFPWVITMGKPLTLALMVASFAAAIFLGGVVHSSLVISSTVMYGTLGVIALAVFSGVENAISELLEAQLRLPGTVGSLVAGAATAVVVLPAQRLLRVLLRRARARTEASESSVTPTAAT